MSLHCETQCGENCLCVSGNKKNLLIMARRTVPLLFIGKAARSMLWVWCEQYPVSPGELQVKDMNEMKQTIRELPESSRPYEKCLQWGPSVLSDSELLAVILRSGVQGCNSLVLANQILSLTKDTSYP